MTDVGGYLKKEREARNLNIREVAELTKISERYLACIETGDYDQLPPGPYAKGYIAAYARQVCGDERQALALYADYCNATQESQLSVPPNGDAVSTPSDPVPTNAPASKANGNGESRWSARIANGFNIAAHVRRALPDGGNLRHLSSGEGKANKAGLGEKLKSLMAPLARLRPNFASIPKGALLKGGLLGGLMLSGVAVLVLAGYGAYFLFFYPGDRPATRQSQAPAATVAAAPKISGDSPPSVTKAAEPGKAQAALEVAVVDSGTMRNATPSTSLKAPMPPEAASVPDTASKQDIPKAADEVPVKKRPAELRPKPPNPVVAAPQPQVATTGAAKTASDTVDGPSNPQDIPLRLMKASVCTSIEDRMPAGVAERFPWTTPKIFVWSLLSASEPPAKVRHIYYHADRIVSDVILRVGSSHWRTWSFHTLSGQAHIGPWRVDIATLDGQVLRRLLFTIE